MNQVSAHQRIFDACGTVQTSGKLRFVQILRRENVRSDGFKPDALGFGDGTAPGLNSNEVHGCRTETAGMCLRLFRPDIPESAAGTAVSAEVGAATAAPHTRSRAQINVGKKVFVGSAFVMVKAEIHSPAVGVRTPAVAHADIMNKAHAEIKPLKRLSSVEYRCHDVRCYSNYPEDALIRRWRAIDRVNFPPINNPLSGFTIRIFRTQQFATELMASVVSAR